MKNRAQIKHQGFTLIEIMTVISIICLLSSIILAGLNVAKASGNDAKKKEESHSVSVALLSYSNNTNSAPANYLNTDGSYNSAGTGNAAAFEDTSNPKNPQTSSGRAYNASMQQLVDAGVLSSIPHSPDPATPYGYYNYGPGTPAGAVFMTDLQTTLPSSTGLPGTCRPFAQSNKFILGSTCLTYVPPSPIPNCSVNYRNGTSCSYNSGDVQAGLAPACPASDITGGSINWCDQGSSRDYCTCSQY